MDNSVKSLRGGKTGSSVDLITPDEAWKQGLKLHQNLGIDYIVNDSALYLRMPDKDRRDGKRPLPGASMRS